MRAKKIVIDRKCGKKTEDQLRRIFQDYMLSGGFPEAVLFNSDVRQQTLQEYLNVAIYKDIVERHEVKSPHLVKYMIFSMIHNVGKPFAVNKFYNDVKSQGYKVGRDMLYEYADHIEDAYLAFSAPVYNRSVRKTHTSSKKFYAIDPGMIRAFTMEYEMDLGRLFENIIYLELRRLGYKVSSYLTADRYEVDFLIQNSRGQKKLFQVAWDVHNSATLEREERALKAAMKELKVEGEIITLDSYLQKGVF
jgi:predicted AAA+ superfamily ATPase